MKKHMFNMQGYFKRVIAGVVVASNVFSYLPTNVNAETDIEQSLETDNVKEDSSNLVEDTSTEEVDEVLVEEIENSLPEDEIIIDEEIKEEVTTSDTEIIEIENAIINNNPDNNINDTDSTDSIENTDSTDSIENIENIDNIDNTDSIENIESEEESSIEVEDITIDDYIIKNQNNDTTTDFNFNDTLKVEVLDTNNSDGISLYLNDELVDTITPINNSTNTLEVNLKELTHLTEGSYGVKVTRNSNNIDTDSIELGSIKISAIPVKMHLDVSKVYDGLNTIQVTDQQLVDANTDLTISDITFNATVTTDSSNVGTYDFNNISTNDAVIVGTNANQYTIENYTFTDTSQVEITKKEITPSITVIDKIYDGTTDANVTVNFNNLVNSDSLLLNTDYTVTATYDSEDVGENIPVTATINLNNTVLANNYSLQSSTASTIGNILNNNIEFVDITVNGHENGLRGVYKFIDTIVVKATPKLPTSSVNNTGTAELYINNILVDTQPATLNNEVTFRCDLWKVFELKPGNHPVKIIYNGSNNSNRIEANIGYLNILDICEINIGSSGVSKYYDGNNEFFNSSLLVDCPPWIRPDLRPEDEMYIEFDAFAPSKNAGQYFYVDMDRVNLRGNRVNHVRLDPDWKPILTILPKPITISSDSELVIQDKVYDKLPYATVEYSNIKFDGLIEGEEFIEGIDYKLHPYFEDIYAGVDKVAYVGVEILENEKTKNYKLQGDATVYTTATIHKLPFNSISNYKITNYTYNKETRDFDFNDIILVDISKDAITRNMEVIPERKLQLYVNDIPVNTQTETVVEYNHTYRLRATLDSLVELSEGTYPLKVKYGGDMNTTEGEIDLGTINISAIEVIPFYFHYNYVPTKVYDGNTLFEDVKTYSLYKVSTTGSPNYYGTYPYSSTDKEDYRWSSGHSPKVGAVATFDMNVSIPDANYYSGSNSIATISNWKIEGERSKHYKLANLPDDKMGYYLSWYINRKEITPEAVIEDKIYDGTNEAVISDIIWHGKIEDDVITKDIDYTINSVTFEDELVGDNKKVNIGFQPVSMTSGAFKNYVIKGTSPFTATGNIIKADSQITNSNILDTTDTPKTEFDFLDTIRITGTPVIKTSQANKANIYFDDELIDSVDCDINNTFTKDIVIEDYPNITAGTHNVKVVWTGDDNHSLSETDYGRIHVIGTPIKAEVSQDIEYNGGNTFEIQTTIVKDKNTDNPILLTVTATVTVDNVNVGTANIISASDITISGNNSNRYEILPEDITGTINIVKKPIKPISVTVKEENNKFEVTDIEFEGNIEDLELGKDFIVTIEKIDGSNDVIVKVELGNTIVSNNYELSVPTIQTTPVKVPTNNNNRPHRPSGGGGSSNSSTEEPSIEEEEIEPVEEETPIKKPPFKDINGHWSQEAIEHLTELGIIVGYPDNTFRPDEKIIRGDTAIVKEKTISHLGHNLETDNHPTFNDVHKEQYYYEAIKNVVNQDIFVGYLDNSFRPENVITREESFVIMSKFIDQYCEGLKPIDTPMVYKDYDKVANWAKPFLDNLNKFGIIKGDNYGNVNPKSEVTRAEISQMLYNILKHNKMI